MPQRKPANPAPFAGGSWKQSDPFSGDTGANPLPAIYSSYGYPNGPEDDAPRYDSAAKIHITLADDETRSGRYHGLPRVLNRPVITPTSYLFLAGSPNTQPSTWHSGIQLPDWMER